MSTRVRLDDALVARGLVPSVDRARAEIAAGNVLVDERPGVRGPAKASDRVGPDQVLRLREQPHRFVSRGGLKLEAALDRWRVDVAGRVVADLGASTGGFTDCLLQRGAQRVYAVDVGTNQLAWKLRQDPRVVVLERTDARDVVLPEALTLVVGDVSFISLARILPAVARLLTFGIGDRTQPAEVVLLVKPQFEAPPRTLDPGGRLSDEGARTAAVTAVLEAATNTGFVVAGQMDSPVPGARAGNVEVLVWLTLAAGAR